MTTSFGVLDVDSHEMTPIHHWTEVFGEEAGPLAAVAERLSFFANRGSSTVHRPDLVADDGEVSEASVWEVKGPDAPSAFDLGRRPEVLDQMGIDRQLVFPTFGLYGYAFRTDPTAPDFFGVDRSERDWTSFGGDIIKVHNAWVGRMTRALGDRLRPVAILETATVEQMLTDLDDLLDSGVRAVMIPGGVPPAGMSPADRRLDPFWAKLAEAGVPVLHHVATERGLLRSLEWGANVPELRASGASDVEFVIDPWRTAVVHYAVENFVTAMLLGGVFERHPGLRFGAVELTAHWVGPLAARLETVIDQFAGRYASFELRPSERIAQNLRVSPFPFEPVERYIEMYPMVAEVLCYASDFPHREGGIRSKQVLQERLAPLGDDVLRRFFSSNGLDLLPV